MHADTSPTCLRNKQLLTINQQQYDFLEQSAHNYFVARVVQEMTEHMPEATNELGPNLFTQIGKWVKSAQSYGLRLGTSVSLYVSLCLIFGDEFETKKGFEWAMATLTDPQCKETVKEQKLRLLAEKYLAGASSDNDKPSRPE